MNKTLLTGAILASAVLAGCASKPDTSRTHYTDPVLHSVQQSADKLATDLARHTLAAPVIVTSAQNNDQLKKVCPQGRLISDIVASSLSQRGIPVTEVRLAQTLRINQEGETILSRDLDVLAKEAKADVVVTSTWMTLSPRAPSDKVIRANANGAPAATRTMPGQSYITLKAVRLSDGLVLSSQTFAPPVSWTCR